MTSKTRRPAERITTSALTANNLGTVRKLNSVLFPIKYSEKFYKDILAPEVEEFCRLSSCPNDANLSAVRQADVSFPAYLNDIPVGTVCCRIEVVDGVSKLYLATMGVLAVSCWLKVPLSCNNSVNASRIAHGVSDLKVSNMF